MLKKQDILVRSMSTDQLEKVTNEMIELGHLNIDFVDNYAESLKSQYWKNEEEYRKQFEPEYLGRLVDDGR